MEILLTAYTHGRWWPAVVDVAPDALPVVVDDGTERIDTTSVAVAWATSDLFRDGLTRRFFGAAVHAPQLRWFHSSGAGVDAPVFDRLRSAGVRLTASHHHAPNIADYVLHAVLDHVLGAPAWRAAQDEGVWRPHGPAEVAGTTWLVVGYGAIGREVARRAQVVGARVVGVRRRPGADGEPVEAMVGPESLADHLPAADVVVLCLPHTESTEGLFGDALLARAKPGALLVNVGRGPVIDEAALVAALDRGAPAAAVLDVTAEEPLPEGHPLWTHPAVTVTPHDSGDPRGEQVEARAVAGFLDNLRAYVAGRAMPDDVSGAATGR